MTITPILVDARNVTEIAPQIIAEMGLADFIGFDIETEDSDRHEGLNLYMKMSDEGEKSASRPLVFDTRRTNVVGFSLYPDGSDNAYYINLNHADAENRVSWEVARSLLDARPDDSYWVSHNAPFEIVMMRNALGYDVSERMICSLQLAVTAYGPDEYPWGAFEMAGLGGIKALIGKIAKDYAGYDPNLNQDLTSDQAATLAQVIGKSSKAKHSYNGFVDDISYHYDLKRAIKSWFDYDMTTFEQVLGDKVHMGQLTGEDTVSYGADDAYWAVRLFHRLLEYMSQTNPGGIKTFFEQENPMVTVYADCWQAGTKINFAAVKKRQLIERENCATTVRDLKAHIKALLPFPASHNEKLMAVDGKWYKNFKRYRDRISAWAGSPDSENDFEQVSQIGGAVSTAWLEESGQKKSKGPNFTHYMMMRTVLYDLCGLKLIVSEGKVQSDAEARGRLLERANDEENPNQNVIGILRAINELAGIEQRMKLYINPYMLLTDPDTERMYSVLSSKLATRRMATSFPNTMQLAKQGESTYIRGFYEADEEDHAIVSLDWSQIELVLIGELSGDPEFAKAYSKLPYDDLHSVAAADLLGVTLEDFKKLKIAPEDSKDITFGDRYGTIYGIPLIDHKGNSLTPSACYKYNRGTDGGKGMNFNYWYSGALSTIGERRGWSAEKMWEVTERYRQRFAVAEQWRTGTIEQARVHGFVTLPDGLRRVRMEATPQWYNSWMARWEYFQNDALLRFGHLAGQRIQRRAGNQVVNSLIQGSSATLAKRSILKILSECRSRGWDERIVRFMMPIHDELVWSVHRDYVIPFIELAKSVMTNHPEIISKLKMHCTASVGLTFEPYHGSKAPYGQIELDEAPNASFIPEAKYGKELDNSEVEGVLDYLYSTARRMAA